LPFQAVAFYGIEEYPVGLPVLFSEIPEGGRTAHGFRNFFGIAPFHCHLTLSLIQPGVVLETARFRFSLLWQYHRQLPGPGGASRTAMPASVHEKIFFAMPQSP
jgi:hypothetical protein